MRLEIVSAWAFLFILAVFFYLFGALAVQMIEWVLRGARSVRDVSDWLMRHACDVFDGKA